MAVRTGLTQRQRESLRRMRQREDAAFRARVPKSVALGSQARQLMPAGVPMAWMSGFYRTPPLWVSHGSGATFTDVDGNSYTDFNVCDMSGILGYAHPRLTEVISAQAARGVQMFLPAEPALAVCQQLRQRFGLPQWQFTLSASAANTEALRIARVATGRQGMLLFAGKFHGQLDETLWSADGTGFVPQELGVGATGHIRLSHQAPGTHRADRVRTRRLRLRCRRPGASEPCRRPDPAVGPRPPVDQQSLD